MFWTVYCTDVHLFKWGVLFGIGRSNNKTTVHARTSVQSQLVKGRIAAFHLLAMLHWAEASLSPKRLTIDSAVLHNKSCAQHTDHATRDVGSNRSHRALHAGDAA